MFDLTVRDILKRFLNLFQQIRLKVGHILTQILSTDFTHPQFGQGDLTNQRY